MSIGSEYFSGSVVTISYKSRMLFVSTKNQPSRICACTGGALQCALKVKLYASSVCSLQFLYRFLVKK